MTLSNRFICAYFIIHCDFTRDRGTLSKRGASKRRRIGSGNTLQSYFLERDNDYNKLGYGEQ